MRPQTHNNISVKSLNRFTIFFTGRLRGKFAGNWLLKIPPTLAYEATLPCENITPRKQAINDKLQGSVATYLRPGGVVNNRIKKGLLISVSEKKTIFDISEYLAKLQARWLSRALVSGHHTAKL